MFSEVKFVDEKWMGEYKFRIFKEGVILREVIFFYV